MTALTSQKPWHGMDLAAAPTADPVAVGGSLDPAALLAAYQAGVYPLPAADAEGTLINRLLYETDVNAGRIIALEGRADPFELLWFCPDPRPAIPATGARLSTTVRRALRRNGSTWHTTADTRFRDVVQGCRHGRHPQWITDELASSLSALHEAGWAHSVEVWDGQLLVGGVFGIATGAVFSADSMFFTAPDAGKIAVVDLADRLGETPVRLIDVQTASRHSTQLGAVTVDRVSYLGMLSSPARPVPIDPDGRPAARLAAGRGSP